MTAMTVLPATGLTAHSDSDPKATLATGLTGRFGQFAQLGAVGVMAFILVAGGIGIFFLVRDEMRSAREDRMAERQIEREDNRSMRDLLGRVVQTLDRLDRSQNEHAARLADLARIVERIERRLPEKAGEDGPDVCVPRPPPVRGPPGWLVRFALPFLLFDPPAGESSSPVPSPGPPPNPVRFSRSEPPAIPPKDERPNADGAPIRIAVGRFTWAYTVKALPVTYDVDDPEILSDLTFPSTVSYPGVKFDAPAGSRPRHNAPPAAAKGNVCALLAVKPGRVRVTVWVNAGEGKPPELLASQIFEVFDPASPAPEVKPDKPEVKPGDKPEVKPLPSTVLGTRFKGIYLAMTDPDKRILIGLGALAMEAAAMACDDRSIADCGALEAAVLKRNKKDFQADRLKPFGPAIAEHLLPVLPSDQPQTPLTDELRAKLKAHYLAAAAAFREVNP